MICIDTDCIIDFLKGRKEAVSAVENHRDSMFTTEINRLEVLFGIHLRGKDSSEETEAAEQFFDAIDVLPFDPGCAETAAETLASLARKGRMIGQNDAFIAAVASVNGLVQSTPHQATRLYEPSSFHIHLKSLRAAKALAVRQTVSLSAFHVTLSLKYEVNPKERRDSAVPTV